MSKYELKLDTFQGPLEKLLELIEAKELEITRLNLAEVTADFLEYIRSLGEIDPDSSRARAYGTSLEDRGAATTIGVDSRVLADFITVAARLILIKSHALLPQLELTEEEEGDIAELERRLKLYKEFRAVEKSIADVWDKKTAYAREYLLELPKGFYLTEKVSPSDLRNVIEKFYEGLQSFIPKAEEGEIILVSLEEMIEEMIRRVDKVIKTSFGEITEGREKTEIIVLFLALLHLLKDSTLEIEQDGLFAEIQIVKMGER